MDARTALSAAVVATVAMLVTVGAHAGLGRVTVGSAMPDFTLTDYTGKQHQLSKYAGKVVVIDFLSKDCPWSRGAAPQIAALARGYEGEDVVFIGINANDGTTHDSMKQYGESVSIPYAIVIDERNKYADTVGATRTPEMYVIDRDGKLAYHGAYDNRKSPEEVGGENYTKNAIDAVLAGKPVAKPEVSAWGCTIKRVAKNAG